MKALPGTSTLQFTILASVDPFDSLPIYMGGRSCELLSYCTWLSLVEPCHGLGESTINTYNGSHEGEIRGFLQPQRGFSVSARSTD
jgi:hypothetical protein